MPRVRGRHVQQQHVLDVALQNAGLHGGAQGHDFVRVHALVRLAAEELLHRGLDLGHAGHAADQDHFVDVGLLEARVLQRLLAGADGADDQVLHQRFELGACQLHVEVERAVGVHRDEGQVHVVLLSGRQFLLGLFSLFAKALQGQLVLAQVDAVFLLELIGQEVDQTQVEVLAAQEGVAVGGLHLEHAVADFQHGHVEGAAAEVIDGDLLAVALLQAIGQGRRGGLVDDAQDFQAGDAARVLGRLALGVVEVGRNGDHRLGHGLAEVSLGGFLHFDQREGGNLLRAVVLAVRPDPGVAVGTLDDLVGHHALVLRHDGVVELAPDQALDGEEGVDGVGDGLALGRLADDTFAVVEKSDHRWGGARALGVLDHFRGLPVHDRDTRIGRAEVDTDNLAHDEICSLLTGGRMVRPYVEAPECRPRFDRVSDKVAETRGDALPYSAAYGKAPCLRKGFGGVRTDSSGPGGLGREATRRRI